MSIGAFGGVNSSAAGAPLSSQSASKETAKIETSAQARQTDTDKHAEKTAGIGQTEEDHGASDRDADGRKLWEQAPEGHESSGNEKDKKKSKDTSGSAGNSLDLTG